MTKIAFLALSLASSRIFSLCHFLTARFHPEDSVIHADLPLQPATLSDVLAQADPILWVRIFRTRWSSASYLPC
jgi:hypothetical protein